MIGSGWQWVAIVGKSWQELVGNSWQWLAMDANGGWRSQMTLRSIYIAPVALVGNTSCFHRKTLLQPQNPAHTLTLVRHSTLQENTIKYVVVVVVEPQNKPTIAQSPVIDPLVSASSEKGA